MLNATPEPPVRRVASVQHAARVLNLLATDQQSRGVTEIAREVGLGKSTVHTLLATLCDEEYVERTEDSRYRLGLGAFHLGAAATPGVPADGRLTPHLWALADESGEAVSLAIAHRGDAVIVQRVESQSLLRAEIRVGTRMPLHSSASGKVLLANMPDESVRAIYPHEDLPQSAASTIGTRTALFEEIESVRATGFATNLGEYADGVSGLATLVVGRAHRAPLALSIAGPSNRFDPAEWVRRAKRAAESMQRVME